MVLMYISLMSSEVELISYFYWLFGYLPLWNEIFFSIGLYTFTYWFLEILYIFFFSFFPSIDSWWAFCQLYVLQILSPIVWVLFILLMVFFLMTKNTSCSPVQLFVLLVVNFLCLFKDIFAYCKIIKICSYILRT